MGEISPQGIMQGREKKKSGKMKVRMGLNSPSFWLLASIQKFVIKSARCIQSQIAYLWKDISRKTNLQIDA